MRLEFHRLIATDISSIMTYYEDVGGPKLANEFYSELRQFFLYRRQILIRCGTQFGTQNGAERAVEAVDAVHAMGILLSKFGGR